MSNSVSVSYCTNNPMGTSSSSVTFVLGIANGGFSTINLADVTVRYWFSGDGNAPSGMVFTCDYAQNGATITAAVNGTFAAAPMGNVTATSDTYLEVSFTSAAMSLAQITGSASVQVRFHGGTTQNPYMDMFTETNDYSFNGANKCSTLVSSTTITAYLKGMLVWGCEPGAGGSGSSSSSSGGADASPNDGAAEAAGGG
jgi:hypothetical protein